MDIPEYAYCESCKAIRPVEFSELEGPDQSGKFKAVGELVCTVCYCPLLTFYAPGDVREKVRPISSRGVLRGN